jgi:hypothetical protein
MLFDPENEGYSVPKLRGKIEQYLADLENKNNAEQTIHLKLTPFHNAEVAIDPLNREVEQALATVNKLDNNSLPRPQALLKELKENKQKYPIAQKIIASAKSVAGVSSLVFFLEAKTFHPCCMVSSPIPKQTPQLIFGVPFLSLP